MPEVRPQDGRPHRPSERRDGVRGARMYLPFAADTLTATSCSGQTASAPATSFPQLTYLHHEGPSQNRNARKRIDCRRI